MGFIKLSKWFFGLLFLSLGAGLEYVMVSNNPKLTSPVGLTLLTVVLIAVGTIILRIKTK